jgi:hypothetical protein
VSYDPSTPDEVEAMRMKQRITTWLRRSAPTLGLMLACLVLVAEVTLAVLVFG